MSFLLEKAIGSKVESAGKTLGITDDGDADKAEREKKKEMKEKKEMEERKQKYLEERRVKRHEENRARNDKIRNKYTFAEKEEEKKSSGYSLFTKQEPKKTPQQSKMNPQHTSQICVVEGCNRSASVVQPVCPQCDQPVCYSHRLEADHPCSAVAIVKGAAGSVLDSVRDYVDSSTSESREPSEKKEKGGEGEPSTVKRELGGGAAAKDEEGEEELSWDSLSRKLEETKESLSDAVQSSLRELNLAGEPELTEEEKRYWGGLPEAGKETPPHHRGSQEEEKGMDFGEVVDEVTTSISSWFSGESNDNAGGKQNENQQKESEGSSFFSSWF